MLIAQITDIHIGFDRDNPDEYNMQRLRAVIARMTNSPNRPDMLLMTGDLTEFGDRESFERLAEAVKDCPFPVWPLVGNHDMREPLREAFPDTPSEDGFIQYALDGNGVRLVILDTLEPGRHGGSFCEVRARWLSRELAAHPDTPTVLVMHHPPFESGISWLDGDEGEAWMARFAKSVAGHDQVRAVITGHLHRNIHTLWNGVSMTVCASTAPLVALDLRPCDSNVPDGRDMITDELPVYALHRWDGQRLISHFECVSDHRVIARYDQTLQPVVRTIAEEKPGAGSRSG